MSSNNINVFKEVAIVAGTVVVSSASYYAAVYCWSKYIPLRSVVSKITQAKSVPIAGLRSLVSTESSKSGLDSSKEMLVVVCGITKANSRNESKSDSLVSHISREDCVVLEQTWGSVTSGERKTSLTVNPFVLRGIGNQASYEVFVNLEGSNHQLPLKVYDSPYSNIPTSGSEYLVQEKLLPVGERISAVGICSLQDGNLQIKACNDLPFFLLGQSDYQMVGELIIKPSQYRALSFIMGSFSLALFATVALPKMYILWKKWKQRKEL